MVRIKWSKVKQEYKIQEFKHIAEDLLRKRRTVCKTHEDKFRNVNYKKKECGSLYLRTWLT